MERIRAAIDRAKAARAGAAPPGQAGPAGEGRPPPQWQALRPAAPSPGRLSRGRIVTASKDDPAYVPFDVLRTKITRLFETNGWSSIAVTSPTMGCGKTMIAANLAFSFARQPGARCILADIDLRRPQLRKVLGIETGRSMGDYLKGGVLPADVFARVGDRLAVGAGIKPHRRPAELLRRPDAADALRRMREDLLPNVVIYDLPPMLASEDAMAFMEHVDCALLVAAAGHTTAKSLDECERRLSERLPVAGVILNKYDPKDEADAYFRYDYA